jgi:hypothetical protein
MDVGLTTRSMFASLFAAKGRVKRLLPVAAVQGLVRMECRDKFWFAALILCLAGATGCGGRAGTAQVSGRVVFKDGTVPRGDVCVVRFQPADDSPAKIRKAASGEIERDGWFQAYTRKPGDGVFLGRYDVTFSVLQDATDSSTSLIDPKYTKAKTTPYHVTIEDDVDDLLFEIEPIQASK